MADDYSQFERKRLEGLSMSNRRQIMVEIESTLTARLHSCREWEEYWSEVTRIIADLKAVGHDLWSHDYDGERRHLWGWDYMQLATAGFLQIQFEYQGPVRTFWRGEDSLLGVLDES